jgi:hypothetical protein
MGMPLFTIKPAAKNIRPMLTTRDFATKLEAVCSNVSYPRNILALCRVSAAGTISLGWSSGLDKHLPALSENRPPIPPAALLLFVPPRESVCQFLKITGWRQ